MNLALITKRWWLLFVHPTGALQNLLQYKYGPRRGSWTAKSRNSSNISPFWKDVMSIANFSWHSIIFRVGENPKVAFWKEQWHCPNKLSNLFLLIFELAIDKDALVGDYWHRGRWNLALARNVTLENTNPLVELKTLLYGVSPGDSEWDIPVWRWNT